MFRNFLFFIVVIFLIVSSFLFLLNVASILANSYFDYFITYDEELGFSIMSNISADSNEFGLKTNEFGFNDYNYSFNKKGDEYRLMIINDSFGWTPLAFGEDFTAVLEKKLDGEFIKNKIDVINIGYPATQTAEEIAILKKYGLKYEIDMAILGFYVGNDFIDSIEGQKATAFFGVLVSMDERLYNKFFGKPLILPNTIKSILNNYKNSILSIEALKGGEFEHISLVENYHLSIVNRYMNFCSKESIENGLYKDSIEYVRENIKDMKSLFDRIGVKFAVSIYPAQYQIDEYLREEVSERFDIDIENYKLDCQQEILKSILNEEGIEYIDFLDRFNSDSRSLYIENDIHWNKNGADLASDILFEYMVPIIENYYDREGI